jgi:hypothetical protein
VRHALLEFQQRMSNQVDPLRDGQAHLTLCRLWQDIATELGSPQFRRANARPSPLSASELAALRKAASGPDS